MLRCVSQDLLDRVLRRLKSDGMTRNLPVVLSNSSKEDRNVAQASASAPAVILASPSSLSLLSEQSQGSVAIGWSSVVRRAGPPD